MLADPRSGARLPLGTTVAHADPLLRVDRWAAAAAPEVVLRLGAPHASKVLGQWLTDGPAAGADVVAVVPPGRWLDPERVAASVVAADPAAVVAGLLAIEPGVGAAAPDDWLTAWVAADQAADDAIAAVIAAHDEPTEPGVARTVVASAPDGAVAVVASSMPIRDVEWYAAPRDGLTVLANRGANGIDGVVSTAVGVAVGSRRPVTALVGDIAFLHDANALLGAAGRGIDLTIVVVDNDGGGIFSFLPQAELLAPDRFELLFGTPHGRRPRPARGRSRRARRDRRHRRRPRTRARRRDLGAGRCRWSMSGPTGPPTSRSTTRSTRRWPPRSKPVQGRTRTPSRAWSLSRVSASSVSGSESATMPLPAQTRAAGPVDLGAADAHRPRPVAPAVDPADRARCTAGGRAARSRR